jgi:predicted flap endonuclease-1-like 5' DNA nuclease
MLRKLSIIVTLLLTGLSLAGFAFPSSSMAEEESGNPWLLWVFVVIALVAFVVFLVWWWRRGGDEEEEPTIASPARQGVAVPAAEVSEEAAAEATAAEEAAVEGPTDEAAAAEEPAPPPPEPDDLKVIEGIGPKISSVFQAAGITTFAQLAGASTGQLEQILEEANPNLLRLAKPATWPEQAQLAAEGKWEELDKLQDELHGGQRS